MQKFLAYPLSFISYIFFGLTLIVFHPIQWVCLNLSGYNFHHRSVIGLQFWLMRCLNLLGTRFSFENDYNIPSGKPLIIVANHQSMYDIPPILWYFKNHHPKFISKKELGSGIPSVSYNLRHGGSVLIDRSNPDASLTAISFFARRIQANNWAAVIFPEGTRSKNGKPRPFKKKGLQSLIKNIPNAILVPLSITNTWKIMPHGLFPLGLGTHVKLLVHCPLNVKNENHDKLIKAVENKIIEGLK